MPAKIQHPFSARKSTTLRDGLTPPVVGALGGIAAAIYSAKNGDILDTDSLPGGTVSNQIILSLLGFIVGYGAFRMCNWLRIKVLKTLFTYHGWVTQPKSTKTKVWGLLVSLLRGKGPFTTFQFQSLLPKQPLPELDKTLDGWLQVAANLVAPDDLRSTTEAVEEFRRNEGPRIQTYLENKAANNDSWIHDYWLNGAYLCSRQPIAIYSNYFVAHSHTSDTIDPTARVATLTHGMARLEQMLSEEKFQPVFIQNLVPLCMHGYNFVFNCNRIPGEFIDELVRYPGHGHIVVIRSSQYYRVDLYHVNQDGSKSLLSPLEIKLQFQHILQDAADLEKQPPVAALTAQNRTVWAQQRKELLKRNKAVLEDIETSMFVVSLDEKAPKDYCDLARTTLIGDGSSTWFDKGVTFSGFSNGWVGSNIEHSALDAMVFINMQEFILVAEQYENDDVIKSTAPRKLPHPTLLKWDLTDMVDNINTAMDDYQNLASGLQMRVVHPPYGKGFMKKQRLSPDGYIQMSLQLAFYRIHKHTPKTYEPSTHRFFHLGRTETVHPASPHSLAWVKAMDDPKATSQVRIDLLKKAVSNQTNYRLHATIGEGCDRHLMAMLCASREMGMDLPKVFQDKMWQMPFLLSTSQTPNNFVEYGCDAEFTSCVGGFGPTALDGYGIAYCVLGDDVINFQIASWSTSEISDVARFSQQLESAFHDMKALFT